MRKVGFTASRQGITREQHAIVVELLYRLYEKGAEFHHGNCVNGDERGLDIAQSYGYHTEAHPAKGLEKLQLSVFRSDASRNYRAPQARNKTIVNETEPLIACPKEMDEPEPKRGQGTWSTVRYARKQGKPIIIVWPDGRIEEENVPST